MIRDFDLPNGRKLKMMTHTSYKKVGRLRDVSGTRRTVTIEIDGEEVSHRVCIGENEEKKKKFRRAVEKWIKKNCGVELDLFFI